MKSPVEFRMPDVGEGIAEAVIVEWLVADGDTVKEDQAIVVVETDKAQVELPAPANGVIQIVRGKEGDIVKVGDLLTRIAAGTPASPPADSRVPARDTTLTGGPEAPAGPDSTTGPDKNRSTQATSRRPLASPSTRLLAVRLGIDLSTVTGRGPHGRIQASDLDMPSTTGLVSSSPSEPRPRAGTVPAPTVPTKSGRENTLHPMRGLRRQIARSMTEALQIPHVTEFREVDASALVAAHAALKSQLERDGIRLSVLPFLIKATVRALQRHTSFNATYDANSEEVTRYGGVHLGMATATADGLIVPVIRNADELGLRAIAIEIERVAELARTRKASPEQLGGGSFTVTNFGSFGTWFGTPIIRPPEVAIAGFGRIREQVVVVDGQPAVRPVLPIVVAADHRINDGAHLAAFVRDIADALAEPMLLLLE